MNITLRIAVVTVIQTLSLCLMIGTKQWTLQTGEPILLETAPVDPRSLFRGDYARLNYKISSLDIDELGGDRDFQMNDRVYVALRKGERYWEPVSVHHARPSVPSDLVAIKGTATSVNVPVGVSSAMGQAGHKIIRVRYDIETYFVPEGTGAELERRSSGNKISILAAVDRFGNGGIKAVLVNGRTKYAETLF